MALTMCILSRRVGGIQKGLLPSSDMGFLGMEFDMREKPFSHPWNPQFGDDTTSFECGQFIA